MLSSHIILNVKKKKIEDLQIYQENGQKSKFFVILKRIFDCRRQKLDERVIISYNFAE